jgi:diaminopimelate decarboxylase
MQRAESDFGHTPRQLAFWRRLVRGALERHETPFYLFSTQPLQQALDRLESIRPGIPVRHWLSCKTQPVAPWLRWWRDQGRPIEVVSEFELLAARHEGFPAERILINGPAKHRWLTRYPLRNLSVHLDSWRELDVLPPLARRSNWRLGVRVLTGEEYDFDKPALPTQFGLEPAAAVRALRALLRAQARVESVHFHLRTNVANAASYARAIREVADVCRQARFAPRFLDCGGGFPPPHTRSNGGRFFAARFDFAAIERLLRRAVTQLPGLEEIWLENGRFLGACSGALAVRVVDVKERRGLRQAICDGGRTLHALVSNWEDHAVLCVPPRRGRPVPTAIYGPTCMAFDQLPVRALPGDLREGDALIWLDAGAYHVPWEVRFSHGAAKVLWHDGDRIAVAREAEGFDDWWGHWVREGRTGRRRSRERAKAQQV